MLDKRVRYTDSSGHYKIPKGSLILISNEVEKVLVNAVCIICNKSGMAYEDPNNPIKNPHYCFKHLRRRS